MVFVLIIAGIVVGELLIKKRAEDRLDVGEEHLLSPVPIKIRKLHNYGMANNTLQEKPKLVKGIGIGIMSLLVLVFVLLLPLKGRAALKTAMALLIGGGLSNLIDRFLKGYVTDYFSFCTPFKRLNRFVFNLSDLCIFVGAVVAVLAECFRGGA